MDNQDYWNGVERRKPVRNAALEAADKRIAELEAINGLQAQSIGILAKELDEAERKLAVAREAMEDLCDWDGDLVLKDFCEGVLAQIGGDE